jgi:hypothetical protein
MKYELTKWVVNRGKNEGHARVHLHGEHKKMFGGVEKRIEIIDVGIVLGETEGEIVRCAVAASENDWHVGFNVNVNKFQGKFQLKLDSRLKATILNGNASLVSTHEGA